ncbi:MAG: ATP F0F1 synthase subunit B, partial [Rhodobacteraceae bacterium]|nr:ATP F0F1 synthase subunit B [Paracoccaceae bacterium]
MAMKYTLPLVALMATPAFAAGDKPFFSLANTDFVVLIAFIVFVGILLYFKVPAKVGGLLDARAAQIKAELDEARSLRDEARAVLATYDRKQKEVAEQAERIIASAKEEATAAA